MKFQHVRGHAASSYRGKERLHIQAPNLANTLASFRTGGLMKQKKQRHLCKDPEYLAKLATVNYFKENKVSRAHYRVNANRKILGGKLILPEMPAIEEEKETKHEKKKIDAWIYFGASKYRALESDKLVTLTVHCDRKKKESAQNSDNIDEKSKETYTVSYKTGHDHDTATPMEDYIAKEGILTFNASETEHEIKIEIVDDDEKEVDEVFTVTLYDAQGPIQDRVHILPDLKEAKVTIIDDESSGTIEFAVHKNKYEKKMSACYRVAENAGQVAIKVIRKDGSAGKVQVHYKTEDGKGENKAEAGADYIATEGDLIFDTGEVEKYIIITIIDDELFEKDEVFYIKLSDTMGCELGHIRNCKVLIVNDDKMMGVRKQVIKKVKENLGSYTLRTDNYSKQFQEVFICPPEEANCFAKVMYFLLFPFRFLSAFIPPTAFQGGWLAFFVSLLFIGATTTLIGDITKFFGCSVGLPNSLTGLTIVSLGTSLPDTFASMSAAKYDKNADNAIGSILSSNSVNVFLGLGLPWTIATIYRIEGGGKVSLSSDGIETKHLAFTSMIFVICAVISILIIYIRGHCLGAELGGKYTIPTSSFLIFLWLIFIILSVLVLLNFKGIAI